MENHRITGGGGIQLHLVETGNRRGRPVMFIHGVSQCWLSWRRQMSSDLADDFRLVAMDIRGTVFRINLAKATPTRNYGLMT
jgi:non-heme chloroperoxidase